MVDVRLPAAEFKQPIRTIKRRRQEQQEAEVSPLVRVVECEFALGTPPAQYLRHSNDARVVWGAGYHSVHADS